MGNTPTLTSYVMGAQEVSTTADLGFAVIVFNPATRPGVTARLIGALVMARLANLDVAKATPVDETAFAIAPI